MIVVQSDSLVVVVLHERDQISGTAIGTTLSRRVYIVSTTFPGNCLALTCKICQTHERMRLSSRSFLKRYRGKNHFVVLRVLSVFAQHYQSLINAPFYIINVLTI